MIHIGNSMSKMRITDNIFFINYLLYSVILRKIRNQSNFSRKITKMRDNCVNYMLIEENLPHITRFLTERMIKMTVYCIFVDFLISILYNLNIQTEDGEI